MSLDKNRELKVVKMFCAMLYEMQYEMMQCTGYCKMHIC